MPSAETAVIAMLERSLAARPDDAALRHQLGTALARDGRMAEAADQLRRAVSLKPDLVGAHVDLGTVLNAQGRPHEALDAFLAALQLAPGMAAAAFGAGLASRHLGRAAEARGYLEQAVAAAPDTVAFHLTLAESSRFVDGDPRLAPLEALAQRIDTFPVSDRVRLHFALAKAYDDLGRAGEAFERFSQGNAIIRAANRYDEAFAHHAMAAMASGYGAEAMARLGGRGDASDLPVFVIGMPRSGTSLVEQIVDSHAEAAGAGEIPLFNQCLKASIAEADTLFNPEALSGKTLRRIGGHYVEALRATAPAAARIVNKLPGNFLYAGLIHLALPNARIVHVRRNAMDTCFSCFTSLFARGNAFAYDLAEVGRYFQAYHGLMAHWRKVLPPDRLIEVDYEALVTDLPTEARRLVERLGLAWDERCLDFHRNERGVFTISSYQVRRPIYASSIGRWRPYADRLGPLIAALGPLADGGQNR